MVTALIVLDGLRPDAVSLVPTPHLDTFRESGSWSMTATTVVPSMTLPAHLSMLTSVPPDVHGVVENTWATEGRSHPNLIDYVARAGLRVTAFYTWEPLRDLWTPGCMAASWFRNTAYEPNGDQHTAAAVAEYFERSEADFAFVYLGSIDLVGHVSGWMSDAYLQQISVVDAILGGVLSGLGSDATVLVTSDHGGHDTTHGSDLPEDVLIPWMLAGPPVRAGGELGDVSILDTAPTLAHLMGLRPLRSWQGRVIDEAL